MNTIDRVVARYRFAVDDKGRLTDEDIFNILTSEGLRHQGQRSGKAGEFWGKDGWGRMISIGKREILANAFYVMWQGDRGQSQEIERNPDTRWNNYKSFSKINMKEDLLRKIAVWAKGGMSTAEARKLTREFLLDKLHDISDPKANEGPHVTVQFQANWKAPVYHSS